MTTTNNTTPTDVGPAPAPPAWCLPGTLPLFSLSENNREAAWAWQRRVSDYVVIEATDEIREGRIVRNAPKIFCDFEEGPWTIADARREGRALMTAAEVVTEAIQPD